MLALQHHKRSCSSLLCLAFFGILGLTSCLTGPQKSECLQDNDCAALRCIDGHCKAVGTEQTTTNESSSEPDTGPTKERTDTDEKNSSTPDASDGALPKDERPAPDLPIERTPELLPQDRSAPDIPERKASDNSSPEKTPERQVKEAPPKESTPDGTQKTFTPYWSSDFESYPLTQKVPVFNTDGRTVVTSDKAFSGKQSLKVEIKEGDKGGFGRWGFILPIKPTLKKGQEIWVRLRAYWPKSFKFTASPWMKFIRIHNANAANKNHGYNDLYIDEADSTKSVLRCIKEVHNIWEVYNGHPIKRDTWETYEMYLSIDNVSVDKGGKGRMRIWRDGKLIFNRTDVPTIKEASDYLDAVYIFTYWNNEKPPNNHAYIDDMVVATDKSKPLKKDAAGHLFIGP